MRGLLHLLLPTLSVCVIVAAGPAHAQTGWQDDLAAEIEMAQGCRVAFLSHVVERPVEGKQVVMAKAHCEDQRVFDALRPDAGQPFAFTACQPETQQSC